jgi:GT2 family glycosyltransferase
MPANDFVSVTIVTYNSGRFIKRCLDSVLEEKYTNKEIIVVDNASTDGTVDILEQFEGRVKIVYNEENIGFAAAQNQAIRMGRGEWILTLNPDVLLDNDFIQELVDAGKVDSKVGTVCGKLLTILATFDLPEKQLVDSTGIYFTPMLRHLDRGSQEVDNGHYLKPEYVFGATAAAALYRRAMIDDVAIDGEFFDPDFFVYREDADVAWRAQLLGWRCIYTPDARGYHVRNVLPGNRRALPPEINMHSVKNRFLMRIKNITPDLYRRNWLSITTRDLLVASACLLHEQTSLRAFWYLARNWRRVWEKRKAIMARRRVDDEYMANWFSYEPVSRPAPKVQARLAANKATPTKAQARAARGAAARRT